jgi:hypothetical protein
MLDYAQRNDSSCAKCLLQLCGHGIRVLLSEYCVSLKLIC